VSDILAAVKADRKKTDERRGFTQLMPQIPCNSAVEVKK